MLTWELLPQWWQRAYFIQAIGRKRSILTLGKYFKKIACPFFKHHFLFAFQFTLSVFEILCKVECKGMTICLPNDLFLFNLASPILQPLVCDITFVANFWTLWGFKFFIAPMVGRRQLSMMLCRMFLCLLRGMWDFKFYVNKPTFFGRLPFTISADKSTLWFWWMVFGHWLMSSLLTTFQ